MNKPKALLLLAVVLITVVAGVFLFRPLKDRSTVATSDRSVDSPGAAVPSPGFEVAEAPTPHDPAWNTRDDRKHYDTGIKDDQRVTHTQDGKHIINEAIEIARQMNTGDASPEEDAAHLGQALSFYRMVMNENPVGDDNRTVMAALMGENARGIVVFPSDHPSLNDRGELLDRWETPYYFHPLSSVMMEIISLGSDRIHATGDDIIFTERDEDLFFRGITDETDFKLDD